MRCVRRWTRCASWTVPTTYAEPRLVARHVEFGKSPTQAEAWVARVDDANAALVGESRGRADRWVDPAERGG